MSMGAGLGTWLPVMTVMNHWFVRKRTRAMSMVMEGFAVGGVIIPLLLAWAIGGTDPAVSERFGWRLTAFVVGVSIIVLAIPLSRLVRNRPEDVGLLPDGDAPEELPEELSEEPGQLEGQPAPEPQRVVEPGFTWQQAIRTKAFWLISFGHATSSIVIVTVMVHLGLMLDDRGFSLQTISAVVATYTAINAVFILVGGYLGDRMPIRYSAFGFSAIQSVAVVVLVLAHDKTMLFLFAAILGVGFGGRTPVTTAIRGVYFGRRAFAAITGISKMPMNVLLFSRASICGLHTGPHWSVRRAIS